MKPLALLLATVGTPALACGVIPGATGIIAYTHHVDGGGDFDEGLRIRGLVLAWDCGDWNLSASAYDHSFYGHDIGYTVSATYDPLTYRQGPFSLAPIAGMSVYPDKPTKALQETGGFFPMIGLSATYRHDSGGGAFVNVYPSLIRNGDYSFDALVVAGITWEVGR